MALDPSNVTCDDRMKHVKEDAKSVTTPRVHFGDVKIYHMYHWSYAYRSSRRNIWGQYAINRMHFARRIANVERVLIRILDKEHREMIYRKIYERVF